MAFKSSYMWKYGHSILSNNDIDVIKCVVYGRYGNIKGFMDGIYVDAQVPTMIIMMRTTFHVMAAMFLRSG